MWIGRRRRFFAKALSRLIFIDETSTNTRLTKRTGWSPKGERYRTHAPFGKWHTQTFIAGLRCHGMIAPWIVDAPMNGRRFETWMETQLTPELKAGDVVILDNVGFHKSERAAELVRKCGAWLLCQRRSNSRPLRRSKSRPVGAAEAVREARFPISAVASERPSGFGVAVVVRRFVADRPFRRWPGFAPPRQPWRLPGDGQRIASVDSCRHSCSGYARGGSTGRAARR